MHILKLFDLLVKVGSLFSVFGELITRLGIGGNIIVAPVSLPGDETMSQDTSNTNQGAEDEKPEEENNTSSN